MGVYGLRGHFAEVVPAAFNGCVDMRRDEIMTASDAMRWEFEMR
jgi:hypothetical protein